MLAEVLVHDLLQRHEDGPEVERRVARAWLNAGPVLLPERRRRRNEILRISRSPPRGERLVAVLPRASLSADASCATASARAAATFGEERVARREFFQRASRSNDPRSSAVAAASRAPKASARPRRGRRLDEAARTAPENGSHHSALAKCRAAWTKSLAASAAFPASAASSPRP